jgi:uncharacterized repeat protein (TIGR02543 family)
VPRIATFAAAALAAAAISAAAESGIRVEPRLQSVATSHGLAKAARPRAASVRTFRLEPPVIPDALRAADAPRHGVPLQVGFGRDVPGLRAADDLRGALEWTALPGGGKVAAVSVTSANALSIRAALRVDALPEAAVVRFFGPDGEAFEASGGEILAATARNLEAGERGPEAFLYWSPLIDGDTIVIEVELSPGDAEAAVRLAVPRISHLVTSAAKDFVVSPKAAACELDAMCSATTWGAQIDAVARMVFSDGGSTYVCTGTLLADMDTGSTVPYFLTARHCIGTQTAASSLATYWFYRSTTCNGSSVGPYQQLAGGATLLHTAAATDTAFLRLNNIPPAGAMYAGWFVGATPGLGSALTALHHPGGEWLKISNGRLAAYATCTPPSGGSFSCSGASGSSGTFYDVEWSSGVTEPGSSGSGLFRSDGLLVGQLYGGSSQCGGGGSDVYGRFDVAYNDRLYRWLSGQPLTVAKTGIGTVTSTPAGIACGSTCSATFTTGTTVTVSPAPAAGYTFAGWSGACTGTASCTVTMNAAVNLVASFVPSTAALTVSKDGAGTVTSSPAGINCGSACSSSFPSGTQVTLSATAASGMVFRGWSGACTGSVACVVAMSAARSVTATFAPPPSADLAVAQSTTPGTPVAGKDAIVALSLINKGPEVATDATLRWTVPGGWNLVWLPSGCSVETAIVSCRASSVPAGTAARFDVVARPATTGTVSSSVEVAASLADPMPSDNARTDDLTVVAAPTANLVQRYRLYSPVTLEHHFTTDQNEYEVLGTRVGTWFQEGRAGRVLDNPGAFNGVEAVPYYRLYNVYTRWHHWTTDPNEYYTLATLEGWSAEGVDGYILPRATAGATELYRLVLPNGTGLHHWTVDANEVAVLTSTFGWLLEPGAGFVVE